ncbi:MAG TPA: serine protease [Peptococcaceae bacterium]|nr:serine protease [Peptococcaceae bacterium]
MKRRIVFLAFVVLLCLWQLPLGLWAAAPSDIAVSGTSFTYVISVEEAVEAGLSSYMERALAEAAADPAAQAVIIEIDTLGGDVEAAQSIRKTIEACPLQTIALIRGGAISAGTYIAMSCDLIAMQPGTTLGDVEPRAGAERADEKFLSYWKAEMAALAEAHGRDKEIAKAMVDRDMVLEGIKPAGKLLTLTAQEAKEVGYADHLVADRAELKQVLGLSATVDKEVLPSKAEKIARILTHPYISPLLLMVGLAGIAIEIFTVGFGFAGIIGGLSLVLYFAGHLVAGFTGWGAILLFLVGIVLLLVEVAMPGFGIPGISGILCLVAGIIVTAPTLQIGIESLVIALLGSWVLIALALKFLTKRKFWNRLILNLKFNKEQGYISQKEDNNQHIGKRARSITPLRPSGIAVLEDGTRMDVVSEGGFIEPDQWVVISRIDGPRIIVIKEPTQNH